MNRRFTVGLVLLLGAFPAAAQPETPSALAKRLAEELLQATIKGDYRRLADLTYPAVLKEMGGKEKMVSFLETATKQMQAQGFGFHSATVGEPGPVMSEGKNTFIVVPFTNVMTTPQGKLQSKGYMLGISTDKGKSWTFVDGTGLEDKAKRDKLIPKLPAKLVLPAKQKPTVLKDK